MTHSTYNNSGLILIYVTLIKFGIVHYLDSVGPEVENGVPIGPNWVFPLLFPENDVILDRVFFSILILNVVRWKHFIISNSEGDILSLYSYKMVRKLACMPNTILGMILFCLWEVFKFKEFYRKLISCVHF